MSAPLTTRKDGVWLVLEAPLPGSGALAGAWPLVRSNGRLDGLAKIVLRGPRPSPWVVAEVPLDDDAGEGIPLETTHRGFAQALDPGLASEAGPPAPEDPANAFEDLAGLCAAAGWGVRDRPGRAPVVPLDAGDASFHAEIEVLGHAGVRVATTVVRARDLAPECLEALGVLLLAAGGCVRMARGIATEEPGGAVSAGFEALLGPAPGTPVLGHALSALSIACRLSGAEARAVLDPAVAHRYLSVRGWSARSEAGR